MLVDANILLYSVDTTSRFHGAADRWLTVALNGDRPVGLPWLSLTAFVRIATNPRATAYPLRADEAWEHVEAWLDAPTAWVPVPGPRHRDILGDLVVRHELRAGMITDAILAALCIEHGLDIVSADTDFARFPEVTWTNPMAP